MRTIHCFTLDAIVAIILGDEELEVVLWVLDAADLIFLVDEVSGRVSVVFVKLNSKVILP